MKTRLVLMGGLSALIFGGTMVGCTATGGGVASASTRNDTQSAKEAAKNAGKAQGALAQHDAVAAIPFAEGAVQLSPRDVGYRLLLGQSYLQGGRFASAAQAFADTLTLLPSNGKAALNLALAQIATGEFQPARATLAANSTIIPAADRGLAMALAGDTAGAITVLSEAARTPGSGVKVRQNLALSLALGGQWQAARVVAATDLAPGDVDARMQEWAAFAQPKGASDQVASLLGVHAVADAGQPIALALNAPVQVASATQTVADSAPVAAPTPMVVPPVAVAVAPSTAPNAAMKIAFSQPKEVVQALPTMLLQPAKGAPKVALATWPKPAVARVAPKGEWFVQLGAFSNAAVAKDAWGRMSRHFAGYTPTGTDFAAKSGNFYRLSIGGFTRAQADATCKKVRARGGVCFVRAAAGDQMATWLRKGGVQVASR